MEQENLKLYYAFLKFNIYFIDTLIGEIGNKDYLNTIKYIPFILINSTINSNIASKDVFLNYGNKFSENNFGIHDFKNFKK